jgi:hypothetical protein
LENIPCGLKVGGGYPVLRAFASFPGKVNPTWLNDDGDRHQLAILSREPLESATKDFHQNWVQTDPEQMTMERPKRTLEEQDSESSDPRKRMNHIPTTLTLAQATAFQEDDGHFRETDSN